MNQDYENDNGYPSEFEPEQIPIRVGGILKWAAVIIGVVAIFALFSLARSVYTDWLWYEALGYRGVYIKILFTRVGLFGAGMLIAGIVLAINIFIAYRKSDGPGNVSLPEDAVDFLRKLVLWGSVGAGVLLSLMFGAALATQWEYFLRFLESVPFGQTDPVYGLDLGFYVFALPVYGFVQGWLLGILIVSALAALAIYFIRSGLRGDRFSITPAIKLHMSVMGALILFTIAAGLWIDRWELLLSEDGAVFGAAYTDLNARRPALLISAIIAVASGILLLVNIWLTGMRLFTGAVALWVVASIVLGAVWPSIVQRFTVTPNEFVRESEFISHNLQFTRQGYGLDNINEQFYQAGSEVSAELIAENSLTINNIRLWDYRPLTDVYRQIQLIRPYYDFLGVDVGRYTLGGAYRQVLVATREVAPDKLQPESQTWLNRHLFYTHGIGIAMSPVTEFTPEGRPLFFAKDIPADGVIPIGVEDAPEPELVVDNPRVYYGENTADYVIVKTNTDELDFQTEEGDLIRTSYSGDGGVELSSFFRRMAYAWQFADVNILISGEITGQSLIQYRRQVQERIRTIAPFLWLDKDPYIVVADGQLYWIQDAYTVTDHFPYSDPTVTAGEERVNYIRNSVKITVDAFNGDVNMYEWDSNDPIIATYRGMFPGLFKSQNEMPPALAEHVRYPQDMFDLQAHKYAKYHMKDPQNFYNNEDLWAIPNEKFGQEEQLQPVESYYVIMKLPGEEREEFVLLLPYTPNQRQNLIGWLAARSDRENYGKLVAFNFPKDRQIDGPEQVEARIDNDQDISAWFTLRCSEGSVCIRGNLLVIPIGESLLYAEPVYIRAEGVRFPELKRVILATGDRVVMEDSLNDALEALTGFQADAVAAPTNGQAPATAPAVGTDLQQQIESLLSTLDELKDNVSEIEEALDRLKDLTGGN